MWYIDGKTKRSVKEMIRKFIAAFVIIFFAASTASAEGIKSGADWDKGLLIVEGNAVGPPTLDKNARFYKNFARQGARLDALNKLVEYLGAAESFSNVELNEISEKFSHENPAMKIIERGARQIGEATFDKDGVCTVWMSLPLFGENSVAQGLCLSLKTQSKKDFPQPTPVENISEKYTGLIVDCRGFKVYRNLTQNISCVSEKESVTIYGAEYLDFNKIGDTFINQGMVSYVRDMKDAARAGNNPLVVKAINSGVVSVADAVLILNANRTCGFLDRCAVVFVMD